MGCGASRVPAWETAVTDGWERFQLMRSQLPGGKYELAIAYGAGTLLVRVDPYKNRAGHLSVKSVNPFSATFDVANAQVYDCCHGPR